MVAKAMLRDGHLPGESQRIRAALIIHFGVESGEEGMGEFGEIHGGALDGAAPKNEIRDGRKRKQNQRQYYRIPESEPDADGIKPGSSRLEMRPWHADATRCFRLRRPRFPNQLEGQRSSRRHGGHGATALSDPRQLYGARHSTPPRSD